MTTTPILRSRTPRTREPICPPWCEGHNDTYEPWDKYGPKDILARDHSFTVGLDGLESGEFSVTINAFEVHGTNELQSPTVDIYSSQRVRDISPAQAQKALEILRSQLERIEGWQA